MLTSLEDTRLQSISQLTIIVVAVVNFTAPILSGAITLAPFLLVGDSDIKLAAYISLGLAITILFVVGAAMGRAGQRNPWIQGTRMAVAGVAAFLICFWIESVL